LIGLLIIAIGIIIWILNIRHIISGDWSYILPSIIAFIGLALSLVTWLFPFSQAAPTSSIGHSSSQLTPLQSSSGNTATSVDAIPQPVSTNPKTNQQAEATVSSNMPGTMVQVLPSSIFPFNVPHLPNSDELYGRKRERVTLRDRTRNGTSTSIVGPRRIGKTWLMDYLKLIAPVELGASFQFASLDGTMPKCKTVTEFTTKALDAFSVPLLSSPVTMELDIFEKFIKDQKAKNVTPVLCIDEFEGFFNQQAFDCDFFAGLRYIAQNSGLVLVIASKSPLIDLVGNRCRTSGFFNIFETLTLSPFTLVEAEEFAQAKGMQVGFSNIERDKLLKYGEKGKQQWPPLRLQLVGKMLLEDKNLAAKEGKHYYQPDDLNYWREFERRLEEKYRGAVR
jgi:hypothetical protein